MREGGAWAPPHIAPRKRKTLENCCLKGLKAHFQAPNSRLKKEKEHWIGPVTTAQLLDRSHRQTVYAQQQAQSTVNIKTKSLKPTLVFITEVEEKNFDILLFFFSISS